MNKLKAFTYNEEQERNQRHSVSDGRRSSTVSAAFNIKPRSLSGSQGKQPPEESTDDELGSTFKAMNSKSEQNNSKSDNVILHGRKASTFMGIFRDDAEEKFCNDLEKNNKGKLPLDSISEQKSSNDFENDNLNSNLQEQKLSLRTTGKHSKLSQLLSEKSKFNKKPQLDNIDDIDLSPKTVVDTKLANFNITKNNNIADQLLLPLPNQLDKTSSRSSESDTSIDYDKSKISSNIPSSPDKIKYITIPKTQEQDNLALTPVSSATYYPHQSAVDSPVKSIPNKKKTSQSFEDLHITIPQNVNSSTYDINSQPTSAKDNLSTSVPIVMTIKDLKDWRKNYKIDSDISLNKNKVKKETSMKSNDINKARVDSFVINKQISIKINSNTNGPTIEENHSDKNKEINNENDTKLQVPSIEKPKIIPESSGESATFSDVAKSDLSEATSTEGLTSKPLNELQPVEDDEEEEEEEHSEYPLAVELQPFTSNVGGHTAIFRFSERAVCKALVNRENQWYENIELNNKELLKFMPRYIGVLNVRQHFASQRHASNSNNIPSNGNYSTPIPPASPPNPTSPVTPVSNKKCRKSSKDSDTMVRFKDTIPPTKAESNALSYRRKSSLSQSQKENCKELANTSIGEPLTQIHSVPSTACQSSSMYNCAFPEVVLNDNKHIIPDSLWDRYSNAQPNYTPTSHYEGYLNSPCNLKKSLSNDQEFNKSFSKSTDDIINNSQLQEDFNNKNLTTGNLIEPPLSRFQRNQWDSGSTMINTKLQELVLQEFFAPINNRRDRKGSSGFVHCKRHSGVDDFHDHLAKNNFSKTLEASRSVMDLKEIGKKVSKIQRNVSDLQNQTTPKSASHSVLNEKSDAVDYDPNSHNSDLAAAEAATIAQQQINSSDLLENESVSYESTSGTVVSKFILLEDLTRKMNKPCALDLKMGTRQYGVDAKSSKQRSQRAKCHNTTSRKLGVRICGLKIWNKDYYIKRDKYFGRRVRIGWQFTRALARFFYDGYSVASIIRQIPHLVADIDLLYSELVKLKGYRLYGASLLLMYDGKTKHNRSGKAKLRIIDFARCITKDDLASRSLSFKIPPKYSDSEDRGFLRGLRSLKFYLLMIWNFLTNDTPILENPEDLHDFMNNNAKEFEKNWDWLDEFDKEEESEFNNPKSELRKKWRKYELIFDVEPRHSNTEEVSD